MRARDVDKANADDYTLSWGKEETDEPDDAIESIFSPKNLIKVCSDEPEMTGFRKAQLQQVFNTWTNTSVFNLAFNYLQQKGYEHAHNIDALKEFLWNLWFGTYSRCDGPLGSSGWEHVFIGEWKDRIVDGQHNWQRYYLLQKSNLIQYYGYYSHVANLTGTFKYKWDSEMKRKGGFLIGTSPAFDFSLLTVCALVHPGENGCHYSIDGHPLDITSYTQPCGAGTCLSTAYPTN
ncbi:unnamed protein product [Angiostrongylus costaricensis]|uniref:Endoribonuclease n=1 Tax=Angiostrongylus costaricensis TaxID=334426 RepID=A0A0R3Q1K2_ANGCS|nr:unnamed protein product [Angiostrongylus costaricensis]